MSNWDDVKDCNPIEDLRYAHDKIMGKKEKVFIKEQTIKAKEKVTQFPVDMDNMQRNIMIELLNARREITTENMLTARGCVAIIDALFYLVKEGVQVGIDWGDPNGDKTGGRE